MEYIRLEKTPTTVEVYFVGDQAYIGFDGNIHVPLNRDQLGELSTQFNMAASIYDEFKGGAK